MLEDLHSCGSEIVIISSFGIHRVLTYLKLSSISLCTTQYFACFSYILHWFITNKACLQLLQFCIEEVMLFSVGFKNLSLGIV